MTNNTTFKPLAPTFVVSTAAVQSTGADLALGVISFRVRCIAAAAAYLTWGGSGVASVTPAAGTPAVNTIGVAPGAVVYLEIPAGSFFVASAATAFEVTPGQGGSGG